LGTLTEHALDVYARNKVKPDLEAIDNSYQIKFPFQVYKAHKNAFGALSYVIAIPDSATFVRESDGETIKAADLFRWLNEGIDVSHARLVTDPETGEQKVIASKRLFNYPNPYEPKNWIEPIREKHQRQLPRAIRHVIKKFLNGTR
jgi:hypothetical protein